MKIRPLSARDFCDLPLPPTEHMLKPWLPVAGLGMIHAPRGVGKSYLALAIAKAVCMGEPTLGWEADRPRTVFLLDGEMRANHLQERLKLFFGEELPINLMVASADEHKRPFPCLTTQLGQEAVMEAAKDADLLILDNLATLTRRDESDVEAWRLVQTFLQDLRARGKSVIVIHHSGKSGDQRGTSAREDVMDTIIRLEQPDGYSSEDGALFEVHFTKSRTFKGPEAASFEARLDETSGDFERRPLRRDARLERMMAMHAEGKTMTEIAAMTGVAVSTISRRIKAAQASLHFAPPKGDAKRNEPSDGPADAEGEPGIEEED